MTEFPIEPKRDDRDVRRPSEKQPNRDERSDDREPVGNDELPPPEKYPPVVEYDD